MKKYSNGKDDLKETLIDIAEKLEAKGFEIEVLNFGHCFHAYLSEKMNYEECFGKETKNGCVISAEETYRHNATSENVTITMRVIRYSKYCGTIQGKDEKKIRFRIDASDNVKNKRSEEIIERYNRFA